MKQAGEQEWKNLTEKQRQLRLAELKRKERQLRREGKKLRTVLGEFKNESICASKSVRKLIVFRTTQDDMMKSTNYSATFLRMKQLFNN